MRIGVSGAGTPAATALRRLAAATSRRWSSSGELPSLKAALRAVYKRVHPDLFHDCPPAKEANTRSFKLLHEFLEAARTGSHVPLPYRFHFFVRSVEGGTGGGDMAAAQAASPAAAAGASAETPGASPLAGLREVTLTLPPPTRGAPGEAMSGSSRKAFGQLLAALGLPARWGAGEGDEAGPGGEEHSRLVSLRDFLPQAVETVHQHAAEQSGAQHQLGALRTALRLGRRVAAGFGGPLAAAGVLTQLPLLQRLVAALGSLPPDLDLGGLRVTIGASGGVDALGTLWLAADGTEAEWARQLAGVDVAQCRQRQQLAAGAKAQEAAVAAALGLAMVYPRHPEDRLGPAYRRALERLAAAAAARGPAARGRHRDLPLMLCRDEGVEAGGGGGGGGGAELGGCTVDAAAGLLCAPLSVGAEQLYAAVERLGDQVAAAAAARRRQEAALGALRTQAERKLMLRRLTRGPGVSDAQYRSCLERMLAHERRLAGLLHGTAVRVAEVNAVSADRGVIEVAWNWRM